MPRCGVLKFGTDGVRGVANLDLTPEIVLALGRAAARVLPSWRFVVGRDTRRSGPLLEAALVAGLAAEGADVVALGVVPTPAVAWVAAREGVAGAVISASHNPFEDNGIKVFSGGGEKFSEELERHVESIVADTSWEVPAGEADAVPGEALVERYLAHVREALPDPGALAGARIVVDCANGATTSVAPRLFRDLGFDVTFIGDAPDGRNINLHCGSTHPEGLARTVLADGYRLGVAFDGDGDRAIFVDEGGRIVDGDAVMLMCARRLQSEGRLRGNAVVATVMSNIGLELALGESRISLVRCQVGDKYVMEELLKRDLSLGGEQSGHIIFTEYLFTGDGLVTALSVLRVMRDTGRSLAELASDLTTYPQVLVNVRVKERTDLRQVPEIARVMDRVESQLADHGRLLVRYSGTEPLLRIMLEGRDAAEIRTWAGEIADEVKKRLG
jgi:phosphoglucosamine mutase